MSDVTRKNKPGPGSGARSRGRELALKFLYAFDVGKQGSPEAFDELALSQDVGGVVVDFARRLVDGVKRDRDALDAQITGLAKNWKLSRMAVIDRNILRLGAWELLNMTETPPSVVINEAIELGKAFSTAQSSKFINGILDKIRASIPGAGDGTDKKPEG